MHIKQVVISGFKTYKEQTKLSEDFHKGSNVVVGFNGSGKSNFFNAILFVISDEFGRLDDNTRRALLHEGSGVQVETAYVELVLDNTDRRMATGGNEVRIKRSIGMKKDEYHLDGKCARKADIFNLLESWGFDKQNPYYIVKQGKVAELTSMTDSKCLRLLKDVSGVALFDQKYQEWEKNLLNVKKRQEETEEKFGHVTKRMDELAKDTEELRQFQEANKNKRALEYSLCLSDLETAQKGIEKAIEKKEEKQVEERELTEKLAASK